MRRTNALALKFAQQRRKSIILLDKNHRSNKE
jgi:hypothetical protein